MQSAISSSVFTRWSASKMVRLLYVLVLYSLATNVSSDSTASRTLDRLLEQFAKFQVQLDLIEAKLTTLQDTINQKLSTGESTCSVREITEAIKKQKFQYAEGKLNQLQDKNQIANIVHDLYADTKGNTYIVLDFARSLIDGDTQLRVNDALLEEVVSTNSSDPNKLIELIGVQRRAIMRGKNITSERKTKCKSTIDAAVEQVKAIATDILKTAMMNDDYQENVEVENLVTAIYDFCPDLSNEVIERVVDSVFGVVAAGDIINNIASHTHIEQTITGLKAMFYRFYNAGILNNDATLILAANLQLLQERNNYGLVSQDLKDDIAKIIDTLPTCAKSLFFNHNVCFWNKGREEYLYASGTLYADLSKLRKVFTWHANDLPHGAMWTVTGTAGDFHFINREHVDEYLYPSIKQFNKDSRPVFSREENQKNMEMFKWRVELDGDYCYVKSTNYNEYLFASTIQYDKMNNYVFTWKPGTLVKRPEFQWQIRNCGSAPSVDYE